MVSIGVASSPCHAPARSRIRRLAYESAIGLKEDFAVETSRTATSRPEPRKPRASVQPTGPAPRINTSMPRSGIAHQRLDVVHRLRRLGGENLAAARRDEHVVLDPHAEIAQPLRDVVRGADVEARLDGERHAGRQRAPFARAPIAARAVPVELVHVDDAGDYGRAGKWRALAPGMTLTVVPGLYIR